MFKVKLPAKIQLFSKNYEEMYLFYSIFSLNFAV